MRAINTSESLLVSGAGLLADFIDDLCGNGSSVIIRNIEIPEIPIKAPPGYPFTPLPCPKDPSIDDLIKQMPRMTIGHLVEDI